MALTKDLKLSEELMKYIKASDKKDRIFSEIINKKDNVNRIIKGIKDIQWKIVNYTIALFGSLIGIAKILNIKTINFAIIEYLLLAILAILLWVFSMNMLVKTSEDLKYYRKHMEINEIIEDELTGIIFKTNNLVNELLDDDKRSQYVWYLQY